MMFQIKICGVRFKQDIDAVADAGGDAVGLNFYQPSIRYVAPSDPATVELSRHSKKRGLKCVGVFVNESVDQILEIANVIDLNIVQLHGDESTEVATRLMEHGCQLIRAVKLPKTELTPQTIADRAGPWSEIGCHVLLDADAGKHHGGSGLTLNWNMVAAWSEANSEDADWTLAGGLNSTNVAEAIALSGAQSVDTASGVEEPRGTKCPTRIAQFVSACQQALR